MDIMRVFVLVVEVFFWGFDIGFLLLLIYFDSLGEVRYRDFKEN